MKSYISRKLPLETRITDQIFVFRSCCFGKSLSGSVTVSPCRMVFPFFSSAKNATCERHRIERQHVLDSDLAKYSAGFGHNNRKQREFHTEGAAPALLARDLDVAVMGGTDRFDYGESEPGSATGAGAG